MSMYDYCILEGPDLAALSEKALLLGWNGLCLLDAGFPEGAKGKKNGIDIVRGTLIEADKAETVRKEAPKRRQRFEVIAVRGLSEEANRATVETPTVDILLPGEDSRIDYVMVKLAKKNNVAIALDLNRVMMSNRLGRAQEFSMLADTAKLIRRFGSPFVLTSGAYSPWDMRSLSELLRAFPGI